MTIKGPGTFLKMSEIIAEFGGTAPHSLSEYYRGGSFVNGSVAGIPASGAIKFSDFYGKAKAFQIIISVDTVHFNLTNYLYSIGHAIQPMEYHVIVNPGIYVYADRIDIPAFDTGDMVSGATVLLENKGCLMGKGGDGAAVINGKPTSGTPGGPALRNRVPITINNSEGYIFGGGGGGGGAYCSRDIGGWSCGGGGGAGGGKGGITGGPGNIVPSGGNTPNLRSPGQPGTVGETITNGTSDPYYFYRGVGIGGTSGGRAAPFEPSAISTGPQIIVAGLNFTVQSPTGGRGRGAGGAVFAGEIYTDLAGMQTADIFLRGGDNYDLDGEIRVSVAGSIPDGYWLVGGVGGDYGEAGTTPVVGAWYQMYTDGSSGNGVILAPGAGGPSIISYASISWTSGYDMNSRVKGGIFSYAHSQPSSFSTPGTHELFIPYNVGRLRIKQMAGAGGGGGGYSSWGDSWRGGAGASGGYYSEVIIDVPRGVTMQVDIGKGGVRGYHSFNSNYWPSPENTNSPAYNGMRGGDTVLRFGATPYLTTTGGEGGVYGRASVGGWPNGVGGGWWQAMNDYGPVAGGVNAIGKGNGGQSNMSVPYWDIPKDGEHGYLWFEYIYD